MNLQLQPNHWSCSPTALAMVLDEPVHAIINEIGHDGSEIFKADLPDPYCRKGFHIQELTILCLRRNKALIQLDSKLVILEDEQLFTFATHKNYIDKYMKDNIGILLGVINYKQHSVAWDMFKIYDPCDGIYAKGFFTIESFLMIKDIK